MPSFFNQKEEEVFKYFNTSKRGLTLEEVSKRLTDYGKNLLLEQKRYSLIQILLSQFKDLLVGILIGAAVISFIVGNRDSALVIIMVLIINAILGTVQYIKAEKSLTSLKSLIAPSAKVIREGNMALVSSSDLVPGDILILEAGDIVTADGRIVENYSIEINESALTGESESVGKSITCINELKIPLGDQKNMVFSGSLVTYGRATVVVTATGMHTEVGKIACLMNATKQKETPLQISLNIFSKRLAIGVLIICMIVFGLSIYRQMPILDSLMFAVALAVAAIPEALSSIVTIVLALGAQRMAKQNAIIKELGAVESLGSTSIICSDKTGTLTQNKMRVKAIYKMDETIDSEKLNLTNRVDEILLKACVLCNDSITHSDEKIGDPTEIALVDLAEIYHVDEEELRCKYRRIAEIAFDSNRKLMSTLQEIDNEFILFTKGACDVLLERVDRIYTTSGVQVVTEEDKEKIRGINQHFCESGLRVLCIAYKDIQTEKKITLEDENNYIFLALIAMIDPPRIESKEAVIDCIRAGIKPIMITGDYKVTACSIAKEIGIYKDGDLAIDGIELDNMTKQELDEKLEHISVYARVSPEHKIKIVEAWQQRGDVVAMTGDGVNDAPALKQADIGVAMGITGTEVSKDAAAMILADDNFSTIVKAVENGRSIYRNIKNAIHFLLSGNTAGILCVLYTSLIGLPVPFTAVQLLFINLLTDSLPAIAIGLEPMSKDVLDEKPRNLKEPILNRRFFSLLIGEGIVIALCTLVAFYMGLSSGSIDIARGMAFATLCLSRLFHGFNCRNEGPLHEVGFLSNKAVIVAFGIGFLLLNGVLFISGISSVFNVYEITSIRLGLIYVLAFIPTVCIQIYKVGRAFIKKQKCK